MKSMVVIRRPRDGAVLVSTGEDADGNRFERPLGGHAEFCESAADTACREIREEIAQELRDVRLLHVLENIFELDGVAGHEVVFLFEARFADDSAYDIDEQVILDELPQRVRVRWREPPASTPRLVPDGIQQLINP